MNIELLDIGRDIQLAKKKPMNSEITQSKTKISNLDRDTIMNMYSEYASSLYNYFYYSLGDKFAAEDLVGDVFVKIINKSNYYNTQKGDLKVWLFAVARNTLRDYMKAIRRKKPRISLNEVEDLHASEYDNPVKSTEIKIEILALKQALEILNKRERSIISLKYGAGLRNKDIAKILMLTEKHIGVILSRTITKLKKQLGDAFYD